MEIQYNTIQYNYGTTGAAYHHGILRSYFAIQAYNSLHDLHVTNGIRNNRSDELGRMHATAGRSVNDT